MKKSQINPQEHSEIKVLLLRKYLEKYINVLSLAKYVNEVEVYDLFCGEGIYENGKEGSPIIILKLINEIYLRNKHSNASPVKFKCHFNDIDAKKLDKLKEILDKDNLHINEIGSVHFSNKDYQVVKHGLFNRSTPPNRRTFVFIDPYGYKDISILDIENILSDGYSEVLLFLPTQFMYRFEKDATPESLQNFLNEAMKKDELSGSKSGIDFIKNLRDGFSEKLKERHYVDSFIITREANQYFAMFFFTSHIYGFEKFLEAKWDIDEEEGRGWSPKAHGQIGMFTQADITPNTDKFEENLTNFLRGKRTNIEVHDFTIENRHLIPHANKVLKGLQDDGKLKVTLLDGTTARKGSFYIGWDETKSKSVKTNIQLI